MATHPSPKRAAASPTIPDRLYFKIGDVAKICDVETYVLRFWESQFPQLKPNKSGTGQRLYRRKDVEMALEIKRLVHGEGYTLSGARQALTQGRKTEAQAAGSEAAAPQKRDTVAATIGRVRAELREIAGMLGTPTPQNPKKRPRVSSIAPTTPSLFS